MILLIVAAAFPSQMTQSGPDEIVLVHDRSPSYARTLYEAGCGSVIFRAQFSNGETRRMWGRMEHVLVGDQPLPDAVEQIATRVRGRSIRHIRIVNCGTDAAEPVFRGVVEVDNILPRDRHVSPSIWFTISRSNGGWQIGVE